MTDPKKYEEAAKAYVTEKYPLGHAAPFYLRQGFLACASHAAQEGEREHDQQKLWCLVLELVDSPLIGQKYIDDLKSRFTIIQKK